MHPDRRTYTFLNSIDELLTGLRPEMDERLMSDILGDSAAHPTPSSPVDRAESASTGSTPSDQAIAERAYEIYVRTGRLSGTSVQNWLFAKSELEHTARAEVSKRDALPSGQAHGSLPASAIGRQVLPKRPETLGSQDHPEGTRRVKSSGA